MFEIGFWELALVFGLGLVVLGPEKLPKVAEQIGRYAGQARRMARTFTDQIRDEIAAEERRAAGNSPASPGTTAELNMPAFSRPGVDDLIPQATGSAPTTEAADALAAQPLAVQSPETESLDQVQLPPHG